jgi:hypothetical protein
MVENRTKILFQCVLVAAILSASLPQAVGLTATVESLGNGEAIWNNYSDDWTSAAIIKMNVSGTLYDSYCVDLFTGATINETLEVNGPLTNESSAIDWCAVNYILNNFQGDTDLEAAAIQAAIWNFTTAPYGPWPNDSGGPWQFMSDPFADGYDGKRLLPSPNDDDVRIRAFEIINSVPREDGVCTFKFPMRIELVPSETRPQYYQSINLTATVYDQHNAALPNVAVYFDVTEGSGTLDPESGTTNSSGKLLTNLTVTNQNVTVVAWVEGRFGTLLHGEMYTPPRQNITTVTTIPHTIEDSAIVLPIPELPTVALMGTGLLALICYVRFRRRQQ